MLDDVDALTVWNHLRSRMVDAGFGDFDAFAYSIVSDKLASEGEQFPLSPILLQYLTIVKAFGITRLQI